jgi:hypothetical protein
MSTASILIEESIYPVTDDEIISTWESRNKVWNEKWYRFLRRFRLPECMLYYRSDLNATITKDSCVGMY